MSKYRVDFTCPKCGNKTFLAEITGVTANCPVVVSPENVEYGQPTIHGEGSIPEFVCGGNCDFIIPLTHAHERLREQELFKWLKDKNMVKEVIPVHAVVKTDDGSNQAEFDASPWFEQASDDQIIKLANEGFENGYESDYVAQCCSDFDEDVKKFFEYHEQINEINEKHCRDAIGFDCQINRDDAEKWINENRPSLNAELPQ